MFYVPQQALELFLNSSLILYMSYAYKLLFRIFIYLYMLYVYIFIYVNIYVNIYEYVYIYLKNIFIYIDSETKFLKHSICNLQSSKYKQILVL